MHYLFRPGLTITGFTGYGSIGDEAQHQQWQRLFYGHSGASIFWHYTLLNPDLTLSEQGKALAEAFGHLQSGIGRVFMNSTVREDGVAIHFSMASVRGAWITDGKINAELGGDNGSSKNFAELGKRRDAWVKSLEQQNVQFRFLATPQIEAGHARQVQGPDSAVFDRDHRRGSARNRAFHGPRRHRHSATTRPDGWMLVCRWRKPALWAGATKASSAAGRGTWGLKRGYGGDVPRHYPRLRQVAPDRTAARRRPRRPCAGGRL